MYYAIKVIVSALLIVLISEVAKRYSWIGGLIASLPIVSLLAFIWLYHDTKDIEKISALSVSIFWMVIPSLVLFIALPLFLKNNFSFYLSLGFSCALTTVAYYLMFVVLRKIGIQL